MEAYGSHTSTPAELQRRLQLEARGEPFLAYRDADGAEQLLTLRGSERATVGRGPAVDLALDRDPEVSRLHAEIEHIGGACVLCDDGLSQNGSFVNGERIMGRRKRDGDTLRFGATMVLFRSPGEDELGDTRPAADIPVPSLSATQRLVVAALCRPYRDGGAYARPATNRQIADEIFLSVDAVKTHMRALFDKLGVESFAQNEKRLRLVERAFQSGVINSRDL